MEADHEDFEGAGGGEFGGAFAEEADEFVVDDFDDLLSGRDAFHDFLADDLLLHAVNEFAHDFEVDVGGEECGAHFFQGFGHVFFGEFAYAAEVAEGVGEFVGKGLKHGVVGWVVGSWSW